MYFCKFSVKMKQTTDEWKNINLDLSTCNKINPQGPVNIFTTQQYNVSHIWLTEIGIDECTDKRLAWQSMTSPPPPQPQ